MELPDHKTKIICTIGPASSSEEVLEQLILSGMSIARINFSHGTFEQHQEVIHRIRRIAAGLDRVVSILADLPGPKIRVADLGNDPVQLTKGEKINLTPADAKTGIPVDYPDLSKSVKEGSPIYLNDGFIQLQCENVSEEGVGCRVMVGGPISSHKGVNLPGSAVSLNPVTEKDLKIVEFALKEGVHSFSVSFVEKAEDLIKIRDFAQDKDIFLISKIERGEAVKNIDSILEVTDALMIARGDLGVEIPIQEVPVVQKELIHKCNLQGIPVITATHMLESMIENIRPTRAEATDVANAILDGTDAIMLSGETAVGKYPVETVRTMVEIAKKTEMWREKTGWGLELVRKGIDNTNMSVEDVISLQVHQACQRLPLKYIVTPTYSGATPRRVSRFKPDKWIIAMSHFACPSHHLAYSYGVYPIHVTGDFEDWEEVAIKTMKDYGLGGRGDLIVLTQGRPSGKTGETNILKIIPIA